MKQSLPGETVGTSYEAWLVEWGDYVASFERIAAGTDFSAYYEKCECPHWGYVFKGRLRFVYGDGREEIVSAGEKYYVPPGHTFQVIEDAETVEFSPTREYRQHLATVARNTDALSGSLE